MVTGIDCCAPPITILGEPVSATRWPVALPSVARHSRTVAPNEIVDTGWSVRPRCHRPSQPQRPNVEVDFEVAATGKQRCTRETEIVGT